MTQEFRPEAQFIKKIVDTISDRLFILNSSVDEDLVGMKVRLQDLESLIGIGSDGVRMVGIWGLGGSGKTTLAASLKKRVLKHFQSHCTLENVREETNKHGLKKLQHDILLALFRKEEYIQSVQDGKDMIKQMACHRKVLVILDDVDTLDQLEALAGKHNWFGSGSRIIITTRDKHLLRTHKVDEVYPITLLSHGEALHLFNTHAFNKIDHVEDYETLSLRVVSYVAGLPLAIKVLGSFLYDKEEKEWMSALARLEDTPEEKIVECLKISYDGLTTMEKALFLDIACFFRGWRKDKAMPILEACGFHPEIGLKVLSQKALITIVDDGSSVSVDMHDLIQEMGHYIVRREHPNNPEKHSRLWNPAVIKDMYSQDEIMEYNNTEALIIYNKYSLGDFLPRELSKILSKMKKLRFIIAQAVRTSGDNAEGVDFLSNELRYIDFTCYPTSPFPHSFQPMKLVVLKLWDSKLKELWKGYKNLPHLKVLELISTRILRTPDFDGLPLLKKLLLRDCWELEEIHQSLGNHKSLEYLEVSLCDKLKRIPRIYQMKNLKWLHIRARLLDDGEMPRGIGELSNLEELNLSANNFARLDFSLLQLTRLKVLDVSYCVNLLGLPELPSSLAILVAHRCKLLTMVEDFNKNCKQLCQVSLKDGGWSDRLLQSMLKGNAIINGCMFLYLEGVEIPKGFTSLCRGTRCRLELPENWHSDFSGFLICLVNPDGYVSCLPYVRISMKHVSGMDSDVVWEERSGVGNVALVWYVPFGSLIHNAWWDQTYKSLEFDVRGSAKFDSGFGVRLVEKISSQSGLTETSKDSSSHYTPKFKIKHDSPSSLRAYLEPYISRCFE